MNLIETRARGREGSRKILENRAQEREKQIAPLFSVTEINQNIFINRDYFMVGECVRFLFTSCEESPKSYVVNFRTQISSSQSEE